MAFLNGRVSPEPLCPTTSEGETELSDSLHLGKKDKDHFNNNEGTETSIIDCRDANEFQEGLDGIPEEQLYNDNGLLQNGKITPGSRSVKRNSWSNPEGNNSSEKYHTCDRVVLLAVCFMSAASLLLTLLMLFGIVGPLNCTCSGETDSSASVSEASYAELSKNVKDLKKNVSSLKEDSITEVMNELEKLRTTVIKIKLSASDSSNSSKRHQDQSTTDLGLVVNSLNSSVNEKLFDFRQDILQLYQKVDNVTRSQSQDIKGPRGYNGTRGPSGPPGPRGYNGTQGFTGPPGQHGYNGTQGPPGPPGQPGYNGTQGPPGSGNLALCSYNKASSPGQSAANYATETKQITETEGKKFLGVSCGTNDAKVVQLSSSKSGGKRTYTCTCENTLTSGASHMYCFVYYWECPT